MYNKKLNPLQNLELGVGLNPTPSLELGDCQDLPSYK